MRESLINSALLWLDTLRKGSSRRGAARRSRNQMGFSRGDAEAQRKKNVRRARKLLEFALQGRGGIPETKTPRLSVSAGKIPLNPWFLRGA